MTHTLSDYQYELPSDLIASVPQPERSASRLLVIPDGGDSWVDTHYRDLMDYLMPGDCLVFNNTRVIPARLYGQKQTGGAVECLVERILSESEALVHLRSSKSPREGSRLYFSDGQLEASVLGRKDALFHLRFENLSNHSLLDAIERHGEIPLPHYMERSPEAMDSERYQTVYASVPGAVAAPTAGLHFDDVLLSKLKEKGVTTAEITLHVGAGTFQPVRSEDLSDHKMHSERVFVPQSVCDHISQVKSAGGRVIAVGTTVVRSLETAAKQNGCLSAYQGESDLFIRPGFRFDVVDGLITNFHLPGSTLLMLVAAFVGFDEMHAIYSHAIAERYRFYSYGDGMFIEAPKKK